MRHQQNSLTRGKISTKETKGQKKDKNVFSRAITFFVLFCVISLCFLGYVTSFQNNGERNMMFINQGEIMRCVIMSAW